MHIYICICIYSVLVCKIAILISQDSRFVLLFLFKLHNRRPVKLFFFIGKMRKIATRRDIN